MGEEVLVPYDGSDPATDALTYALEQFPEATVTVLHVVTLPESYWSAFGGREDRIPGYEEAVDRGEKLLEEASQTADAAGHEVETDLETGEPHRVIVDRAAEGGFDAVVIGSHGRTGVSRVMLGSVAEKVVRRTPVPVVVVR